MYTYIRGRGWVITPSERFVVFHKDELKPGWVAAPFSSKEVAEGRLNETKNTPDYRLKHTFYVTPFDNQWNPVWKYGVVDLENLCITT